MYESEWLREVGSGNDTWPLFPSYIDLDAPNYVTNYQDKTKTSIMHGLVRIRGLLINPADDVSKAVVTSRIDNPTRMQLAPKPPETVSPHSATNHLSSF